MQNSLTQAFQALPDQVQGARGPRLVTISGPLQGQFFSLTHGQTTIGRKPFNSVILPAAGVSKTHCTVVREEAAIFLIDNNSTNGTFVNGRQLAVQTPTQLVHGDVITIFDSTFLFFDAESNEAVDALPELHVDFQKAAQDADQLLRLATEARKLRHARRR